MQKLLAIRRCAVQALSLYVKLLLFTRWDTLYALYFFLLDACLSTCNLCSQACNCNLPMRIGQQCPKWLFSDPADNAFAYIQ